MRKPRVLLSILIIAAFLSCVLAPAESTAQIQVMKEESLELFRTGIGYFDRGIDASNVYDFNESKKYTRLALSIFLSSRALDPENSYSKAFIYIAKGFMYHLSGSQMRMAIQTDSDPYTVIVQLRRAYYPLKHAQYYYDHALEYLQDPDTINYVKGLRERNNEEIKLVKQFLPQVDYKADRFMRSIETEAKGIVNFDKINDLITERNYSGMSSVIDENNKLAKKLERLKSDNAVGFRDLTKAYAELQPVLESMDQSDEQIKANSAFLGAKLNECIEYTRVAEAGFRDTALSDLCQNLRDNVLKIRASLRKRTGVTI